MAKIIIIINVSQHDSLETNSGKSCPYAPTKGTNNTLAVVLRMKESYQLTHFSDPAVPTPPGNLNT